MRKPPKYGTLVTATWLVILLPMLLAGCTNLSMERTESNGTVVKFKSVNLFQNSTVSKLAVDTKTVSGAYSGLKIGALENETNAEAMKNLGEILGAAAATAARKAVVP